jgi:hypothetical protein
MEQFDKNTHNEILKLMNDCPVYSEIIGKYALFLKYDKNNIDQLYAVHTWATDVMSSFLPLLNYIEDATKSAIIKFLKHKNGEQWINYVETYKMTQVYEGIERTKFAFWTELLKIDCLKTKNGERLILKDNIEILFDLKDNEVEYSTMIQNIDKVRMFRNNIIHHRHIWEINPNFSPKNINECIRDLKKHYLLFFMTLKNINKHKSYFFSKHNIIENFNENCSIDKLNHTIYMYSDHNLKNKIDMEIQKMLKEYKCPKSSQKK